MQKIDKTPDNILAKTYKAWVDKLEEDGEEHPLSRTYYDDIVMNLFRCQKGVCAYTEMNICVKELCDENNWTNDRFSIPEEASYTRDSHIGELDHFDPLLKKKQYWLWENLFMIETKINKIKWNKKVYSYLKPDLEDYAPEKYFDYDDQTHQFTPNTDIEDPAMRDEIKYMIDEVLCLNHGWIRRERENFINETQFRISNNLDYTIDRFFTAVEWTMNGKPDIIIQ